MSGFLMIYIYALIWHLTLCDIDLCHGHKNYILSDEECSDLYFNQNEKISEFGNVKLEWSNLSLKVRPTASKWTNNFLRITTSNMSFCSELKADSLENFYCVTFKSSHKNDTILMEYKIENLPNISFRRFVFSLPSRQNLPLFLYIDQTDLSTLRLKVQKLLPVNIFYYKVEAYKEKNGVSNLLDLRFFDSQDEIHYELYTYNDAGNYYFVVYSLSRDCSENICSVLWTPKVLIERKSTRIVIGIVGASFILPFVFFIFHILTKKYPQEEDVGTSTNNIVVAYKSSTKKHNEVVSSLVALLQDAVKDQTLDLINLSKSSKKFTEKFCNDVLILASQIIYVAPPKHDSKAAVRSLPILTNKKIYCVLFDHCVDNLSTQSELYQIFPLFGKWHEFLDALNAPRTDNIDLYNDLLRKTEDAMLECDLLLKPDVPKIVVTELESHESDSLIGKIVL